MSAEKDQARQLRRELGRQRRAAFQVAIDAARTAEDDQVAAANLETALTRVETLDRRMSALPRVQVVNEPGIYGEGSPHSFLRDLVASAAQFPIPGVNGQHGPQERLLRHNQFEAARVEARAVGHREGLSAGYGITAVTEQRALSNVAGNAGEFVPPDWITSYWASVARAAAPLRSLAVNVPLPPDTLELHLPRIDTFAGVVPQAVENINAPDEYSNSDVIVVPVAAFLGVADISQQLFDRGGMFSDRIVLRDLGEAYGYALEQQMTSGTGSNGQMLGLLNVPATPVSGVPGARVTTYTSASPTPSGLVQAIAQCAAEISDTRLRPPSAVLMRGARWFWTAGSPDGSGGEPTQRPGVGALPTDADLGPFGPLANVPVFLDATLPTNLGTGGNQDVVVLVRGADLLLLEDPAGPRFIAFPSTDAAGQLTVVLQWHCYAAFIPNRYPSAIGTVSGTGLVVQSGF